MQVLPILLRLCNRCAEDAWGTERGPPFGPQGGKMQPLPSRRVRSGQVIMDNKTILAVILSLLVIIGYQYLFAPPPQQQPQSQKKEIETVQTEKKAGSKAPEAVQPIPETMAPGDREIKVENKLYSAVLSSRGGTIKAWKLKTYRDKAGQDVVLLAKPGVIPALASGPDTNFTLASENFTATGGDISISSGTGSVVFEYSKEGRSLRRTFTFFPDSYRVEVTDEVAGMPEYWITLGADFGIFERGEEYTHIGPALLKGADLEEIEQKKLAQPKTIKENIRWIAQEDKYFFSALTPSSPAEEVRAWTHQNTPVIALKAKPGVNKFVLYAGPKEHDRLAGLNLGLEHIINFGFFSIIARPLFWVLKFLYGFLGNYGWAIIILTVVVRLPFIPIVNKGQKAMKRLQDLQPKMNEIREKYKKDPQKMQQEMMELYKKHKVNPMGGCLPMLLQIPVFFALYKVLLVAIELRNAPFIFWIVDLSVKDPYYVLPIVMGITMVIQQKMTPSTMDPTQAKIMMLMPVVFTFMFLNFASGLVLYWLVNNVLGIAQQLYVNRKVAAESP